MNVNPQELARISALAQEIRSILGDDEDVQAIIDTIEGESNFVEIADALIAAMQEDEALTAAISAQVDDMLARRKRIEDRIRAKRTIGLKLLDAAGVKKLERPRATISRLSGRERVDIVDADSVPRQLCVHKETWSPDKKAILAQIKDGSEVPGAVLARGDDVLSIRSR